MKRYEVRTSSGLPVFEGDFNQCEEYISQAVKKGSQPGFLSIHPYTPAAKVQYKHYTDLPEDLRNNVFTEVQWAKKGYFPNDDEGGLLLWTNRNHREKKRYFSQSQVHPGTPEELERYAAAGMKRMEEKHRLVVQGLKAQIDRLERQSEKSREYIEQQEAEANRKLDSLIQAYRGLLCKQANEKWICDMDLPARIVLDTETTGLDPSCDELLQISVLDADTGETVLNTYVRPIWTFRWVTAQHINGISPEMVADAPTMEELLPKLRGIFAAAREVIGYNTSFDLDFLGQYGISTCASIVDVMEEFAAIYGEWSDYRGDYTWQSLTTCAAYYGYDWGEDKAHDSLVDCKATLFCYKRIQAEQALKEENL